MQQWKAESFPRSLKAMEAQTIFLQLIQSCIIYCIKHSRVGQFNTCINCSQLEKSLSHCVLRRQFERAIKSSLKSTTYLGAFGQNKASVDKFKL